MCMRFGCNRQINLCHLFRSMNLSQFWLKAYRHWVSCEHNLHYAPPPSGSGDIVFPMRPSDCPSQFVSNHVNANPPTVFAESFYNFAGVFFTV